VAPQLLRFIGFQLVIVSEKRGYVYLPGNEFPPLDPPAPEAVPIKRFTSDVRLAPAALEYCEK